LTLPDWSRAALALQANFPGVRVIRHFVPQPFGAVVASLRRSVGRSGLGVSHSATSPINCFKSATLSLI